MAWIQIIDEDEATGELKAIYDDLTQRRGKMSNIMRVHSLHPAAMQAHMDLYLKIMFSRSGGLRRADRELIATVVSATNGCPYCVNHHAEALQFYWKDEARVEQVKQDYRALDLPDKTRAMLDYAVRLTEKPSSVTEDDVEAMRRVGFSDAAILDINLITSYFNFVNRIAEGLGVAFDPEEMTGYTY
ncbi:MAG: peroxidase-related enzyme [Bacteroidetes bacterium]|nr:peroxidase-related enzyme [Bacteroidota bacterium]